MSVVVAYKIAPDPHEATVDAQGVVDWSRARPALSGDDPAALALARGIADAVGRDLVGVTVGAAAGTPTARKAALSRGPDRALAVVDEAVTGWNATAVAACVAALVRRVGDATLVVTGDASIDENAKVFSALVAAHLGWPCLQSVRAVEPAGDGWLVTQDVPDGRRVVRVPGPVVVAVTPDAAVARAPGMTDLLAAGRKPFEVVPLAEVAPPTTIAPEVLARHRPVAPARRHQRFTGPDAAADLVAALRADGVWGESS